MKYVNRLTNEQIKEILFDIYFEENIQGLSKEYFEGYIKITSYNSICVNSFDFEDFYISTFLDFAEFENNIKYRKKMLEYFGEQYAIDYLLGE